MRKTSIGTGATLGPSSERPEGSRVLDRVVGAGAEVYLRDRDLPRLIALWPHELTDGQRVDCKSCRSYGAHCARSEGVGAAVIGATTSIGISDC